MAEERQAAFFEVVDDTATCGWNMEDDAKPNPLTLQYIERVTFGVQRKNKTVLSVTARCGERSMTPADVLAMPRKWVDELQPANQTLRGRLSLRRS